MKRRRRLRAPWLRVAATGVAIVGLTGCIHGNPPPCRDADCVGTQDDLAIQDLAEPAADAATQDQAQPADGGEGD